MIASSLALSLSSAAITTSLDFYACSEISGNNKNCKKPNWSKVDGHTHDYRFKQERFGQEEGSTASFFVLKDEAEEVVASNITLQFKNDNSEPKGIWSKSNNETYDTYTLSIGKDKNQNLGLLGSQIGLSPSLQRPALGGAGLKLTDSAGNIGTLTLDFGGITGTEKRLFGISLSATTMSTISGMEMPMGIKDALISLWGNVEIKGGANAQNENARQIIFMLGGGIKGNISIDGSGGRLDTHVFLGRDTRHKKLILLNGSVQTKGKDASTPSLTKITFRAKHNQFLGDLKAISSGQNELDFGDTGDQNTDDWNQMSHIFKGNIIAGDGTNSSSKNSLTFRGKNNKIEGGSTGDSTGSADGSRITAKNGGSNRFLFQNVENTITSMGTEDKRASITTEGNNSQNLFRFQSTNNTIHLSLLESKHSTNHSAANVLSFEGDGAESQVFIQSIRAIPNDNNSDTGGGENHIGKGLFDNSATSKASELTITLNTTPKIDEAKIALYAGTILAGGLGDKDGRNFISVSTLNTTGEISANRGKNSLTIGSRGDLKNIAATNNGKNTLVGKANSTIRVNEDVVAENGGSNELKGNAGSTTIINGRITASNGGNNSLILYTGSRVEVTLIEAKHEGENAIQIGEILTPKSASPTPQSATGSTLATIKTLKASGGDSNVSIQGTESQQSILNANIKTIAGHNNLYFKDAFSFFAPYDPSKGDTGRITTRGGVSTLLFDAAPKEITGAMDAAPLYFFETTGGEANLIIKDEKGAKLTARINTSGEGQTRLLIARSSTASGSLTPSFTANDTDSKNDKFFGMTFKDGFSFTFKDEEVSVDTSEGIQTKSIVQTYGTLYQAAQIAIESAENPSHSFQHRISFSGLVVGSLKQLEDNTAGPQSFVLKIAKDSVLVANIDLTNLGSPQAPLSLEISKGAKLITRDLKDNELTLQSLSLNGASQEDYLRAETLRQGGTLIDLATGGEAIVSRRSGTTPEGVKFKLLAIGNKGGTGEALKGEGGIFRLFVDSMATQGSGTSLNASTLGKDNKAESSGPYGHAYSDRLLIHSASKAAHQVQVVFDSHLSLGDIQSIRYQGGGTEEAENIALATIKADAATLTSKDAVVPASPLGAMDTIVGFNQVSISLIAQDTDDKGKTTTNGAPKNYKTYFIQAVRDKGILRGAKDVTAAALSANYALYLANLNSLNKRMGELREGHHMQGAWGRVFHGRQRANFGAETRSFYTTLQAGYDESVALEGARNFTGLALSYANALGKSKHSFQTLHAISGIGSISSHGLELALYNSYVQDGASEESGWTQGLYSDSIAKLSYIFSTLKLLGQRDSYTTNNFAFSLSQELGYRFALLEDGALYLDPQAELTLGYLSPSAFTQVLGDSVHFLEGHQERIFTLRNRLGLSGGYRLDGLMGEGFRASVYLGASYVYDVMMGGEVKVRVRDASSSAIIPPLSNTDRFVLNLGTNMEVKEDMRLYFDFERSFRDERKAGISTDYQINLGMRYSFGEKGITAMDTKKTEKKPPMRAKDKKGEEDGDTHERKNERGKNP